MQLKSVELAILNISLTNKRWVLVHFPQSLSSRVSSRARVGMIHHRMPKRYTYYMAHLYLYELIYLAIIFNLMGYFMLSWMLCSTSKWINVIFFRFHFAFDLQWSDDSKSSKFTREPLHWWVLMSAACTLSPAVHIVPIAYYQRAAK